MIEFVVMAADVSAKTASPPLWQPLVVAVVTVGGYLLGLKLWVEGRPRDTPRGARRRHWRS